MEQLGSSWMSPNPGAGAGCRHITTHGPYPPGSHQHMARLEKSCEPKAKGPEQGERRLR